MDDYNSDSESSSIEENHDKTRKYLSEKALKRCNV